jgi:hypothetical protein
LHNGNKSNYGILFNEPLFNGNFFITKYFGVPNSQ